MLACNESAHAFFKWDPAKGEYPNLVERDHRGRPQLRSPRVGFPREHSTGGKTTLLGISERENRHVRRFLIHGARSCVTHLDRTRDRLGGWRDGLERRMHVNKVTVALAAKIARTA